MGSFGGYYKGERKKPSKELLAKKAKRVKVAREAPNVVILGKKKKYF